MIPPSLLSSFLPAASYGGMFVLLSSLPPVEKKLGSFLPLRNTLL